MDEHNAIVARVATQARRLYEEKRPFKIYHGTTNSTRKSVSDRNNIIDTSRLNHVFEINTLRRTAMVEPNVSMGTLARATLCYGLLPAVVPEFPAITVGGAIAGTAGESSSFKYGFVSENVKSLELVLANGEIVVADKANNNEELIDGVAGVFGSIAIITLVEIQLVEAKKYVRLTYWPVKSVKDLLQTIEREARDVKNDFLDAIVYARDKGVVVSGTFTEEEEPGEAVQRYSRAKDEWYYLHVQSILSTSLSTRTQTSFIVPTLDYLFRYDRGAFWAAKHVFTYFAIPFTRTTRYLFNPFLHTKTLYHGLHENGMAKDNIIQDILLPFAKVDEFLEWIDAEFGIHPLWLCPFRWRADGRQWGGLKPRTLIKVDDEDNDGARLLISIGLWGPRLPNPSDFVAQNRKIEARVRELGGVKWLYAHNHYTPDEFWTIYDRDSYDRLRTKYSAQHLASVYDKTKYDWGAERRAIEGSWLRWLFSFLWWIWPMPGVYGVIRVLMGSDYLLTSR